MIGFHTGIIAAFKSKPFRITTRASQRARNLEEQEDNTMGNWSTENLLDLSLSHATPLLLSDLDNE